MRRSQDNINQDRNITANGMGEISTVILNNSTNVNKPTTTYHLRSIKKRRIIYIMHMYCRWRSSYQEGSGWDPNSRFNPATFLCMSPGQHIDFQVICRVTLFVFSELRWEEIVRFIDIGGIVNHHYLTFLFSIWRGIPGPGMGQRRKWKFDLKWKVYPAPCLSPVMNNEWVCDCCVISGYFSYVMVRTAYFF